jgi:hypothetical protein
MLVTGLWELSRFARITENCNSMQLIRVRMSDCEHLIQLQSKLAIAPGSHDPRPHLVASTVPASLAPSGPPPGDRRRPSTPRKRLHLAGGDGPLRKKFDQRIDRKPLSGISTTKR